MNEIKQLNQIEAEKIIEAFRKGTVPTQHLDLYSLGRERWLRSAYKDLEFVSHGGSKVRFLCAPWGGGKTHFLMLLRQRIQEQKYLMSYVELNAREAPFDRFEVIFAKVMRGLTLPDGRGIEHMLEDWARRFPYYDAGEIDKELREIAPSLDFRAALRACLQYANTTSPDHRMRILGITSWLQGSRIAPELSKATGIRSNVTISNVSEILGSFLRFVNACGFNGLTLFLDEAEAITSLAQSRKRDEANQNIRKLLDNADEHSGLYVLMSTTPKFLQDPISGAQSYPALWTRIGDVVSDGFQQVSSRSTIIVLPTLEQDDFKELTSRIVDTHSRAYQWNAWSYFDQEAVYDFVSFFLERSDARLIRAFVRGLVYILDVVEEIRDPTTFKNTLVKLQFERGE